MGRLTIRRYQALIKAWGLQDTSPHTPTSPAPSSGRIDVTTEEGARQFMAEWGISGGVTKQ